MGNDFQKQNKGEIIIYQSKGGEVSLDVKLDKETIWLAQSQIALLFVSERSVITKHLRNIFGEGELDEKSNVQKMHIANSDKPVKFYNLDAIISVGYRVNSKRATQFRIWGTKILKEHILKGYTVNQKRLAESQDKFRELQSAIAFLQEKSQKKGLKGQEKEILSLLSNYAKTFSILEQYDKRSIRKPKGRKPEFVLEYQNCVEIIFELNRELVAKKETKEAGNLFGNEVNNKFESIAKNLYQTFDGKELYKTIEEKASHLIYFIIKDHPFLDGNKRIGSFMFVYFLDKNNYLYREIGEKKINDNALVALAILIAESNPKEKEQMIALISQLLK